MRTTLVIIALLGAIICGYAVMADVRLEIGLADVVQILYPTDKPTTNFILPPQVDADFTHQFDKLTSEYRRGYLIISGLGGCIFIFGFTGLIIEKKRNARQVAV